jgi:hypothetical protein
VDPAVSSGSAQQALVAQGDAQAKGRRSQGLSCRSSRQKTQYTKGARGPVSTDCLQKTDLHGPKGHGPERPQA